MRLLAVTPAARRRGVGARLMSHSASVPRQNGRARLNVNTSEGNTTAHRFYEAIGFARLPDMIREDGSNASHLRAHAAVAIAPRRVTAGANYRRETHNVRSQSEHWAALVTRLEQIETATGAVGRSAPIADSCALLVQVNDVVLCARELAVGTTVGPLGPARLVTSRPCSRLEHYSASKIGHLPSRTATQSCARLVRCSPA